MWCWLQEGEKSKTEQAVTCVREGDEVTLKACKCKTGSIGAVDLIFRSVSVLTALKGCMFQSCQPLQTRTTLRVQRSCPFTALSPLAPHIPLPPTATIAVSLHASCPLHLLTPDLDTTAAQTQQQKALMRPCRSILHASLPGVRPAFHNLCLSALMTAFAHHSATTTTFMLQHLTVST